MEPEAYIESMLGGSADVAAIAGTRIYAGRAPQETEAPYLVWQIIVSDPEEDHEPQATAEPLEAIQIQVSAYASTYVVAAALSAAALGAFREGSATIVVDASRRDTRDDHTQLFRRDFDITLWA
jgi:hypothetical protein